MLTLSAHLHANEDLGGRVLKVNHAGENGAVCIYAGQMVAARLTARSLLGELAKFKLHEERHRRIFQTELERRGLRRCRSYVLCAIGGYALGVLTGLLGSRAIAATTVAVEQVVLDHLRAQVAALASVDRAAVLAIESIVTEEQDHHDRSVVAARASGIWLKVLFPIVRISTEAVIWLGMHL
jgi:ubiquinone biosynthesis monooxygenase Coq7